MSVQYKDFIRDPKNGAGVQTPSVQMHDFFIENPHYKITDYEPITNGIRAYYEIVK